MDTDEIKKEVLEKIESRYAEALDRIEKSGLDEKSRQEIVVGVSETLLRKAESILDGGLKSEILKKRTEQVRKEIEEQETFQRFTLVFRVQHIVLFTSVILLVFTGLPLKFPESLMAELIFPSEGAFMFAKLIHRLAAAALILDSLFHLYYIVITKDGRNNFRHLLPGFKDAGDVLHNIKYFIGREKSHARFDRFSYIEKFDYWAVYWGIVVMVGTGLGLWFNDQFMKFLPKYLLDVLKEMHSDEALLATLAIVIWHFYNVHFNPSRFPGTMMWWHGKITLEEIKKEHPLEYERIVMRRIEDMPEDKNGPGTERVQVDDR